VAGLRPEVVQDLGDGFFEYEGLGADAQGACLQVLRVTRYEHAASPILNMAETVIFCSAATAS
jgi:hypothetical protein